MTTEITINGSSPTDKWSFVPQEYKIDYDSLAGQDSGRSIDGTMHISWILQKIIKLEITLPPHKYNDPVYAPILSWVQGQSNLLVTFWNYMTHQSETKEMYCSQSSAGYYYKGLVNDVSFELIEMKGE